MTLAWPSMTTTSPTDGPAGLFFWPVRLTAGVIVGGPRRPPGRVPGGLEGDMGGAKNPLAPGISRQ